MRRCLNLFVLGMAVTLAAMLSLAAPALAELELTLDDLLDGSKALITPTPAPTPKPVLADQGFVADLSAVYEDDGSILLSITAGGDVSLGGEEYEQEMNRQGGDIAFPFRNIESYLRDDDLTIINYEGTLTRSDYVPPAKAGATLYTGAPDFAKALASAGVEVAVIANDHSMDHGEEAFADTREALKSAGLTVSEEGQLCIYTAKTVPVAVVSYNALSRTERVMSVLPGDIAAAKERATIVIIYFHWGAERLYIPTEDQVALGHLAAESGADLVLGSHSRRINPIEDYNGVYIVYSMGTLCSSYVGKPSDMTTYLFQTRFRVYEGQATRQNFRLIPLRIATTSERNDFTPTVLTAVTALDSLKTTLNANSQELLFPVSAYPLDDSPEW